MTQKEMDKIFEAITESGVAYLTEVKGVEANLRIAMREVLLFQKIKNSFPKLKIPEGAQEIIDTVAKYMSKQ